MTRKPELSIVTGTAPPTDPPRPLGDPGMALWRRIVNDYRISDSGGQELLCLACEALDRAETLRVLIDQDGEVITTKTGCKAHPALRHELAARTFVARMLDQLGLTFEPIRPVGRPVGGGLGVRGA